MNPLIEQHSVTTALEECGWKPDKQGDFTLRRGKLKAAMTWAGDSGDFHRWDLQGGILPAPSKQRVLADNATLFGPVKQTQRSRGTSCYRVDLPDAPEEASGSGQWLADDAGMSCDARLSWAQAITTCVTGKGETAACEPDATHLVADIKRFGWSATEESGTVLVHLQQPGVFRQLRMETSDTRGVMLVTDLAELDGFSPESLRAVGQLANAANSRLNLVRYAITTEPVHVLRAEVGFGCALIPGTWLSAALRAVENAVALTARELEALRDPELAQLVLAVATA